MLVRRLAFAALLASPTLAQAQHSIRDFQLGGTASVLNRECVRLTPDEPYITGSAWMKKPVDLSQPFEVRVSVVLGEKDEEGADGIVFVLHPSMRQGFRGEGMGFSGLVPSVGIELDTYQNLHLGDPVADHLALMTHGERAHVGAATAVVELPNLEDGARHPMRIAWNPTAGALRVYLDNTLQGTVPGEVLTRAFGPGATVYWGFTAATGRLSNAQDVCLDQKLLSAL